MSSLSNRRKKTSLFNKFFRGFKKRKSGKSKKVTIQHLEFKEISEEDIRKLSTEVHSSSYKVKSGFQSQQDISSDSKLDNTENNNYKIAVIENVCDIKYSDIKSDISHSLNKKDNTPDSNTLTNISSIQNNKQATNIANVSMDKEGKDFNTGTDRNLDKKIAFLTQDTDIVHTQRSYEKDSTKHSFPKATDFELDSNVTKFSKITNKFLLKEIKLISQENSEDSDLSTDITEDSIEELSEDENELLIDYEKNEKTLKDEYFTKGKYITHFFLEMERQFYDPSEVYSMVQYHDCNNIEKPGKEGIINNVHLLLEI